MSVFDCLVAEDLVERRPSCSDAERLALAEHLERCARCRGYAAFVDESRQLYEAVPPRSLSAATRTRLLANARQGDPREPARRRVRGPAMLALAAVAVAVAVALAWPTPPPSPSLATIGADLVPLEAGARAQAGHARIHARDPALVRFDAERSGLHVERGSLDVEVDPGAHRRFTVHLPRFAVRVLGTRFVVRDDGVDVLRGVVQVVAPDGVVLVERLSAGGSWNVPAEPEPAVAPPPPVGSALPDVAQGSTPEPVPASTPEPTTESTTESTTGAAPDAAGLLARARSLLAEGRAAPALRAIRAALAGPRTRTEEAEARSLLADHALVTAEPERAVALYAAVGRRYRELRAGDNAMFAAARLRARRGPPREARALLEEYLRIYPRGRFRTEASRRLAESEGVNP